MPGSLTIIMDFTCDADAFADGPWPAPAPAADEEYESR